MGKDRSTVANLLRLLRLPEPVRQAMARQELSPGHARPLLTLRDAETQVRIAREIVEQGLSVRDVERRVKAVTEPKKARGARTVKPRTDPNTRAAEDRLRQALGTRVRILRQGGGRGGVVEIAVFSEQELARIYEMVLRGARPKATRGGEGGS